MSETTTAAPAGTPITEQTVRVLSEEIFQLAIPDPKMRYSSRWKTRARRAKLHAPPEETTAVNVGTNASALQRLATMPQTTMRYACLAPLLRSCLPLFFLNICIEIRRQHPRHIFGHGILLLVFIGALFTSVKHLSSSALDIVDTRRGFRICRFLSMVLFRLAQNRNCVYHKCLRLSPSNKSGTSRLTGS